MVQIHNITERRTSADDVFDYLHNEIVNLKLLPGTRISEVEIAKQFGVSRQPVREAFIRLGNLKLLLIRPQRATTVRKFSNETIMRARFIRLSVECEVLREACRSPAGNIWPNLAENIKQQQDAMDDGEVDRFHALDYDFHRLLCAAAGREYVFQTIEDCKAQVDRLCMLSLSEPAAMEDLINDHTEISEALKERDEARLIEHIRHHLSRLDETIKRIRKSHADFFED